MGKLVYRTAVAVIGLLFALLVLVLLIEPTLAEAVATVPASNPTTLFNIPPLVWQEVNELLIGLFLAVGTIVWKWMDAHSPLKTSQAEDLSRQAFGAILMAGAKYGASQLQAAETKVGAIDVGNPGVAAAANFVIAHAPDLAKKLGYDVTTAEGQAAVIRSVTARLADVLSVPPGGTSLLAAGAGPIPAAALPPPVEITLPAAVQPPTAPVASPK